MAGSTSTQKLIDTALIIESKGAHEHTIIWLHGFGDSAQGCQGLFTQIQPPNTRIVLPNAPKQWQTIRGRQHHVQTWYPDGEMTVEKGLEVVESINELIDEELKLVKDASHIIIGGFSQGACLSLITGLKYAKQQLGGILCCSGQVPYQETIQDFFSEYATKIPILVLHGKDDDRIKWDEAKIGFELLKKHGLKDNMQVVVEDRVTHTISERGLHLMIMFIVKQFKL